MAPRPDRRPLHRPCHGSALHSCLARQAQPTHCAVPRGMLLQADALAWVPTTGINSTSAGYLQAISMLPAGGFGSLLLRYADATASKLICNFYRTTDGGK